MFDTRKSSVVVWFLLAMGGVAVTMALLFGGMAFAETPVEIGCVNGGGGYTICENPPGEQRCSDATAGRQCDEPVECRCVVNVGGMCVCHD